MQSWSLGTLEPYRQTAILTGSDDRIEPINSQQKHVNFCHFWIKGVSIFAAPKLHQPIQSWCYVQLPRLRQICPRKSGSHKIRAVRSKDVIDLIKSALAQHIGIGKPLVNAR